MDRPVRSWSTSAKEYGRGIVGGIIFSLPIVYTMEMWWAGFTLPPEKLLVNVLVTLALLLGYNYFCGLRSGESFWEELRESVEEIGLAFLITFLFLWLIGRLDWNMSYVEMAGKTIVETMVVAIGISVGTEQLGMAEQEEESGRESDIRQNSPLRDFIKMIVLSVLSAVLFVAPVASTEEILVIALETSTTQWLIMVVLSLLLVLVTLFFSDFRGTINGDRDVLRMLSHGVTVYLIALLVAYLFLWFYGTTKGITFHTILGQIIVLGVPATLGASAGRLLLSSIN